MAKGKTINQGENLLLLVRRSGKQVQDVAAALDITPTSLSRMFKNETLSPKIKKKAALFFDVPEAYFLEEGADSPDTAQEPTPQISTKKPRKSPVPIEDLEAENEQLRTEVEALRKQLLAAYQGKEEQIASLIETLAAWSRMQNGKNKDKSGDDVTWASRQP